MGTKDVYNHGKDRGLILKIPRAIYNMQMHRRKGLFTKKVSDLFSQDLELFPWFFFFRFIFFRTLIPVILFPETLLAASY